MKKRTHHELTPSLSGACFRRAVVDGRVVLVRAIPTNTTLDRARRAAESDRNKGRPPRSSSGK